MRLHAHVLFAAAALSSGCPGPEPLQPATITTVAGTGEAAFDGDGRPPLETSFYAPLQVFFDAAGQPMIVDWNNHRVRAMESLGMLTVIGDGIEGGAEPNELSIAFSIHHPFQFQPTPDGQIYFAGYHDPRVFRIDADSYVRLVAGNGSSGRAGDGVPAELAFLGAPAGVAVAPDGTVYIADEAYHDIRRVDPDGVIHDFAGTATTGYSGDGGPAIAATFHSPTRLTLDPAGNLYVADTGNHVIRRIDPDGIVTTVAGTGVQGYSGDGGPATEATLFRPVDVTMHPDGGFLIADSRNHVIRYVDSAGIIHTIAGTGEEGYSGDGGPAIEAALKAPHGVTVASDGALWIADSYNHVIRRVEPGY